jgi:hypothetical protein
MMKILFRGGFRAMPDFTQLLIEVESILKHNPGLLYSDYRLGIYLSIKEVTDFPCLTSLSSVNGTICQAFLTS